MSRRAVYINIFFLDCRIGVRTRQYTVVQKVGKEKKKTTKRELGQ